MRKTSFLVLCAILIAISCDQHDGSTIVYLDLHESTIIYLDLNNQEMYDDKPVDIDINSDSLVDFTFSSGFIGHETAKTQMFSVSPERNNKVLFDGELPAYERGQTIYPNPAPTAWWSRYGGDLAADDIEPDDGWNGPWAGVSDRYLAIQLERQDTLFNYGWIRMTLDTTAHRLIVHDAAYESKPGCGIDAGEK